MFVVLRLNVSTTVWYRFRLGLGLCRFPCSWLRFWGLVVTGLLRLWSPFCVWGTFRRVFFWWKCKLRSIRPPCISNWAAVRLGNGNGRNMLRQIRIESTWDFIWYNFQHEHVSDIFWLDPQTYENDSINQDTWPQLGSFLAFVSGVGLLHDPGLPPPPLWSSLFYSSPSVPLAPKLWLCDVGAVRMSHG